MKFRTIINYPGGLQVDAGRRRRIRHGTVVVQGPHTYVVDRVWISDGQQTVDLTRLAG